jgi:hypothetical protein
VRPCWFALLISGSEDFSAVSMATLNDEQRRSIESYAIELLKGVGQNATVCVRESVHVFKELTDAELERLPAGRTVHKAASITGDKSPVTK